MKLILVYVLETVRSASKGIGATLVVRTHARTHAQTHFILMLHRPIQSMHAIITGLYIE